MQNWELLAQSLRHEELVAEAEKARLAQLVRDDEHAVAFNPTLAWVGHRIVEMGAALVKMSGEKNPPADLNRAEKTAKWN
jgi:hypothetical protein